MNNFSKYLESKLNIQWYYHCTLSKNIAGISERGLLPSTKSNWGGTLGNTSIGKIFLSMTSKNAECYGLILFKNELENEGVATIPVVLKVGLTGAAPDAEDKGSFIYNKSIRPEQIVGYWKGIWMPIKQLANYVGVDTFYHINNKNIYEDWEDESIGNMKQVLADVVKLLP